MAYVLLTNFAVLQATMGATMHAENSATNHITASDGENKSEIQSLAREVQVRERSANFWNGWYIKATGLTVFVVALAFFVQSVANRKQRLLGDAQTKLLKLKDDQYALDKAGLDGRARQLEKEAEELKRGTAILTAKNLELEAIIAPRRLSDRQKSALSSLAKFSGRIVEVKSYSSDTEGLILATQILTGLDRSKLRLIDNRSTVQPAGSVSFGVSVDGPDKELITELQRILSLDGHLTEGSAIPTPNRGGISVSVGFGVTGGPPPAAIITVGPKPIKIE